MIRASELADFLLHNNGPVVVESGVITVGFKRQVNNTKITFMPGVKIQAPLTFNGSDDIVIEGGEFEGEGNLAFLSDRYAPIGSITIKDAIFSGVDRPIFCAPVNPGDPVPVSLRVSNCEFIDCFTKVNTAGIALCAKTWTINGNKFIGGGGGNQSHCLYSFFNGFPGTFEDNFMFRCNVENGADMRSGGKYLHNLAVGLPCSLSSFGDIVVAYSVDSDGVCYPSGQASVGMSLTGDHQQSSATMFHNVLANGVGRSTGIVIQGGFVTAKIGGCLLEQAAGETGCAIKTNSSFNSRLEVVANRIQQVGKSFIFDASLLIHAQGNLVDSGGEVAGASLTRDQLGAFMRCGWPVQSVVVQSPVLNLSDWRKYRDEWLQQ